MFPAYNSFSFSLCSRKKWQTAKTKLKKLQLFHRHDPVRISSQLLPETLLAPHKTRRIYVITGGLLRLRFMSLLFVAISFLCPSGERRSDHCLPENLLASPFISRFANNSHTEERQLCKADHSARLTQFKTTGFTISPSTGGYFPTPCKPTSRSGTDL